MRIGLKAPDRDKIEKVVFSIPEVKASVTKLANENLEFDIAAWQDKLNVTANVYMKGGRLLSSLSKDFVTKAG